MIIVGQAANLRRRTIASELLELDRKGEAVASPAQLRDEEGGGCTALRDAVAPDGRHGPPCDDCVSGGVDRHVDGHVVVGPAPTSPR
jgi:hypothetical protein